MKHIVITGGNRGIGLALVKEYLSQSAQVSVTYRTMESSLELLELADSNQNLTCYQLDVTDYEAVTQFATHLSPIDILINNAGYYGPKGYGFGHTDVAEWRKVFEINAIAPLKLVEALYPLLEKAQDKKIMCLSSKVGSMTENTSGGGYIYRSSKAALNSVVKSLSNDLSSSHYTVLALHPGWVQTEMGGPNALITTKQSAQGLVEVIASSSSKDSGRFLNYDGNELPW
ncbi:SDR family NAD(P)-dependent oxidoreductase [Vibrio astriarenae]|uniref:SDR family NAD(P)-dependent oxidoreductase n=1 Tax=Vibrio astriarenae TaxID=1481923 RepID=A0A7Z2T3Q3_9VIBR|nr:SDR family oxidoreductase [Vibrio astriarenae]QIA63809.1 SDR family NAD(P)-dependent oxidoreductase [Vibrio astriarenae]